MEDFEPSEQLESWKRAEQPVVMGDAVISIGRSWQSKRTIVQEGILFDNPFLYFTGMRISKDLNLRYSFIF